MIQWLTSLTCQFISQKTDNSKISRDIIQQAMMKSRWYELELTW